MGRFASECPHCEEVHDLDLCDYDYYIKKDLPCISLCHLCGNQYLIDIDIEITTHEFFGDD